MVTSIPRPESGDVVELILQDHRLFEALLRDLRDTTADQRAALADLSAVLVAHAEAEEAEVYPSLARREAIDGEEAEHGEHEHAEGHEALLAVHEAGDPGSEEFGEAVEELTKALAHHLDEEERTILNPARTEVADDVRQRLGQAFARARTEQLDAGCGDVATVRRLVEQARREGKA